LLNLNLRLTFVRIILIKYKNESKQIIKINLKTIYHQSIIYLKKGGAGEQGRSWVDPGRVGWFILKGKKQENIM